MSKLLKKNYLLIVFLILIAVPLGMAIFDLYYKTIPFWYDPARDFLLALDNQKKLSLIGEPSGIPGLFYGPYWIWLISLALYFSHDPRVVQFLILTLPYFVVFPLILWKLRSVFDTKIIIALWSLFI